LKHYPPNPKEIKVSADLFFKLKELDSLSKMRIKHLSALSEQEDRLSKLTARQNEAHLQTEKLRQDNQAKRHELFEIEKKIQSMQEQKQRLIDIGESGPKVDSYLGQIDEAEEKGLSLLELLEANESEIKDQQQFLAGLTKTITEISGEVEETKAQEQRELENVELRMRLLEEELPSEFRSLYQKTVAKKLAQGPFTRIEAGSCYFCRYKLSKMDESEIDAQQKLKVCHQCYRIFLPYGS
jgi:predicted  nucleic acid-binding Zn-ribbon protein